MFPKPITPITDLQKQTVTQLKTAVTAGMTKRDLLIIANGSDTISTEPTRTYRKDGQIESQSEVIKDVETNAVILTKIITWSYYETGEVDEIAITENGKKKVIKHYLDSRQPTVTEVNL
jgi:hypothetical protein